MTESQSKRPLARKSTLVGKAGVGPVSEGRFPIHVARGVWLVL